MYTGYDGLRRLSDVRLSQTLDRSVSEEEDRAEMDARWMPLFAAAVGVLGGVGGAYVGGVVANKGQERQSQQERTAAIQDLRRDAYGDFLGVAQELQVAPLIPLKQSEINAIGVRLFIAKARVDLVTDEPAVKDAAAEVVDEFTNPTPKADPTTDQFLGAAREDIEATGK